MRELIKTIMLIVSIAGVVALTFWCTIWMIMAQDLTERVQSQERTIKDQETYIGELENTLIDNENWFINYVELSTTCGANE